MMTDWEREKLAQEAEALTRSALARQGDVEAALRPVFRQVMDRHPDEEYRLLDLWDQLTHRRVL